MIPDIIICPDCGQQFDPTIERGEFRSARGTKLKPRVGAHLCGVCRHRSVVVDQSAPAHDGEAMKLAVDVSWLLGENAESVLRQRREEVEDQLQIARAQALVELEPGDALAELVTRALRSMNAIIYEKMLAVRGCVGRDGCIAYCERALRAYYALELIGGVR